MRRGGMSGKAWVVGIALAAAAAQAAALPHAAGLSAQEALAALDADEAAAVDADANDLVERRSGNTVVADPPPVGEGGYSPFAQPLSAQPVSVAVQAGPPRRPATASAQVADEPGLGWSALAGLACLAGVGLLLRRAMAG